MTTRDKRPPRRDDASGGTLPQGHQGFVRGGDVQDKHSQAAAPKHPARPLDRSGEKHYEADLKRFEEEHDGDATAPAGGRRDLDE
jgi:hypothetical protein